MSSSLLLPNITCGLLPSMVCTKLDEINAKTYMHIYTTLKDFSPLTTTVRVAKD